MPASWPFPDPLAVDLRGALAQWQADHPTATLAEIEQAVDQHLSATRAALITRTAMAGESGERPACPECGQRMHRSAMRSVQVTTAHAGQLAIQGQAYVCPACGAGLSPPR